MRACKNLKTLIYEKIEAHIGRWAFKTPEVQKAMQLGEATVENLWLDYKSGYSSGQSKWNDMGGDDELKDNISAMSFDGFVRLKHLKIALNFLLGIKERNQSLAFKLADHLPPSLEILDITHCGDGRNNILIQHLEEVLSLKSTRMPSLKQIIIEAPWDGKPDRWDVSRLVALCRDNSVSLRAIDRSATEKEEDDEQPVSVDPGW